MNDELRALTGLFSTSLRRRIILELAEADGQPWSDDQAASGWTDHMGEVMYGKMADVVERLLWTMKVNTHEAGWKAAESFVACRPITRSDEGVPMTAPLLTATRDALAEVLHQAIRTTGPGIHCDRLADALLASGVLDAVRADAWDEGHEEGCAVPHGCPAHENPYRAEVAP